jgi:hypothetical protein
MSETFQKYVSYYEDNAITNIVNSPESKEYDACTFTIKSKKIIYRTAKITPTKVGQFVTIWKRNKLGITEPFTNADKFDFIIISCKSKNNFGQFIFPKSILIKNGIVTTVNKDGKRGIRVYPSWDKTINPQAIKSQAWQLLYFIKMETPSKEYCNKINQLLDL